MSQLRKLTTMHDAPSRHRIRLALEARAARRVLQRSKLSSSKLMQQIRCHTEGPSAQQEKDGLFNRNISRFRDSFRPNDSSALPFLSSLRAIKDYRQEKVMGLTSLQPFQVSSKFTLNQKIKKDVNDMRANPFRLSKINYRWQNSSGLGVKNSCEFECTLRLSKDAKNPQLSSFYNTIEPIRYRSIEECRYNSKDLICQRQKRLFTLNKA